MTNPSPRGRVLIVAGSDSGGGAGIQADIKTVTALGGYATTAVTAITVQNTRGVTGIHDVPVEIVGAQMRAVLSDIGADAIKTGMLGNAAVIETAAKALDEFAPHVPIIADPVMVAKGGAPLLDPKATGALKAVLIVRATIITPNIPEAEALTGLRITTLDEMKHAAEMMLSLGPKAVLLKGGHLPSAHVYDLLATPAGIETFISPRIETQHTHGTGCTLASAVACGIAQGMGIREAVMRARAYVHEAIRTAPGFGEGHGPINHMHTVRFFSG